MRALDRAFDEAHERRLSLIGVSFGGLIAACYAARRPERVTSLILVSVPAPIWKPTLGDRFCMHFPRLGMPYFAGRAIRRTAPELYRARIRGRTSAAGARYASRVISAPHRAGRLRALGPRMAVVRHHRRMPAHCRAHAHDHRRAGIRPGRAVQNSLQYLRLDSRRGARCSPAPAISASSPSPPDSRKSPAGSFTTANTVERASPRIEERARHAS